MNRYLACLVGVLTIGCGTGLSSDPEADSVIPLEIEPTPLLANVLTTGALATGTLNDATYVAVVYDADTDRARLVRQDLRYPEITELDAMPRGKGEAQLVQSTAGIVWGFEGDGAVPPALRLVAAGGATAIAFADKGPVRLLASDSTSLYYASHQDCAIQVLNLTTGALNPYRALPVSCYSAITSALQTRGTAFFQTSESPGFTIRGISTFTLFGPPILDQSDSKFGGPFGSTTEPVQGADDTQNPAWSRMGRGGKSTILTTPTNPLELRAGTARELGVVTGAVDAGATIHDEFWGATLAAHGSTSTLFQIKNKRVTRYSIAYRPRTMAPLHGQLLILTEEGTLLTQPLPDSRTFPTEP